MTDDIYRELQEYLNSLPVGFPKTESGIELAILRKIYQPDEAKMAILMTPIPETAQAFSQRTGVDPDESSRMLERMASKGQIFRTKKGEASSYHVIPFIPGIYEYQIENMDGEFAEMMEQYFEEGMCPTIHKGEIPLFRSLPIEENLQGMEIMPYDQVTEIIRKQSSIAIIDCVCRKERRLAGHECSHIDDVCIIFSHLARYAVDNGWTQLCSADEAIEAMRRAEQDGLVHSPINALRPMGICNCCGCCCGVLRGMTQFNLPPTQCIRSDFYCQAYAEACTGCEECIERCYFGALTLADDTIRLDREKCIGCGLCVSTCPTEALKLLHKSPEEIQPLPASLGELFITLAEDKI
jgi:NAD-dependent dihydropyrimidine dehydrogenase PreA subunit